MNPSMTAFGGTIESTNCMNPNSIYLAQGPMMGDVSRGAAAARTPSVAIRNEVTKTRYDGG